MENQYAEPIADLLRQIGLTDHTTWQTKALVLGGILLLSWLTAVLFRRLVIPALQRISRQTKVTWDDHLFKDEIMHDLCRLLPPLIWYVLLPVAFPDHPVLLSILRKGALIYLTVAALILIRSFLNTLYEISNEHETLRNRPLKGIYQMFKLIAVCIGGILIISILIDRDATSILAGLGASAAVLMLIFRDSILGLVAGVQLSANDMLRPGDWITMSKYGADGYVTEVSLTTVKVQNFDKTITTIPPYALVSDSFQNWRGMRECGGRRIKRSVAIDARTVRRCSDEEIARFRNLGYIGAEEPDEEVVNLRVFRGYLMHYLKGRQEIRQDLLQMVRMLQPTTEGIPLEVYCFTADTEWTVYERVQSALFDHLLAMLPEFGLAVYQRPAGRDFCTDDRNPTTAKGLKG